MGSQNLRGASRRRSSIGVWCPGGMLLPALLLTLTGCSQTARAPMTSSAAHGTSERAGPERPARARSAEWSYIDAAELPVRLKIPFVSEWRRRETKTSLRLDLAREQVQVLVRLWQTSRLASEAQCLTELSSVEPAFAAGRERTEVVSPSSSESKTTAGSSSGTVTTQAFEPSASFRGQLRAEVGPASGGDALQARVVAVATNVGRCLVFAATTETTDPSAKQRLGERLEWIIEGMAKSLSLRTSEARVQKAPYPIR